MTLTNLSIQSLLVIGLILVVLSPMLWFLSVALLNWLDRNNPRNNLLREFKSVSNEKSHDIQKIVMSGLKIDSNYWISHTLTWLEQGCEVTEESKKKLREISTSQNPIITEETKSRILVILRNIEAQNGI